MGFHRLEGAERRLQSPECERKDTLVLVEGVHALKRQFVAELAAKDAWIPALEARLEHVEALLARQAHPAE